jgi:NADPH-dependent ferric siderophore reductase
MSEGPGARLRREPPAFRQLHVVRTSALSPHLLRVTLTGEELAGFVLEEAAASVRLLLPTAPGDPLVMPTWNGNEFLLPDGTRPLLRTYTPRRWDPAAQELDVDVVLHPGGRAARWAATAAPGDPVAVSGPGRGYAIDAGVSSMLLGGDETALPAIAQLLEVIPGSTAVDVLVEVARPDARLPLPEHPGASVQWVDLPAGSAPGDALVGAVRRASITADAAVWVAGEAAAVQRIRRHLFDERGFSRRQATVRGYWQRGRGGDSEA